MTSEVSAGIAGVSAMVWPLLWLGISFLIAWYSFVPWDPNDIEIVLGSGVVDLVVKRLCPGFLMDADAAWLSMYVRHLEREPLVSSIVRWPC